MNDLKKYKSSSAMLGHMLDGHKISYVEAMVLFGVPTPSAVLAKIKEKGFIVKKQKVPMVKILRRMNQFGRCKPPKELPIKEIFLNEYWLAN